MVDSRILIRLTIKWTLECQKCLVYEIHVFSDAILDKWKCVNYSEVVKHLPLNHTSLRTQKWYSKYNF